MKVAIYARYSSENQSAKSIDDQIRVCKNYIQEHEMTVDDNHIYIDMIIINSHLMFLDIVFTYPYLIINTFRTLIFR